MLEPWASTVANPYFDTDNQDWNLLVDYPAQQSVLGKLSNTSPEPGSARARSKIHHRTRTMRSSTTINNREKQ